MPHAVEVIGFADEEGIRFGSTLLGSRAVAGKFRAEVLDTVDSDGVTMREALHRFGLDAAAIGRAARTREDVLAYAELHIEQGPVLETDDVPVGAVTAINGASRYTAEITGVAGHAGTVPMALRHDALTAAAECVLEIERICRREPEVVLHHQHRQDREGERRSERDGYRTERPCAGANSSHKLGSTLTTSFAPGCA